LPISISNSVRSLLFVPGDQPKKIAKSWQSGADCVVLDLEDGVVPNQRMVARQAVALSLASLPSGLPHILVRINGNPAEWKEDLDSAVHPEVFGLMVPKCASANDLIELDRALQSAEERRGIVGRPIRLFLLIETARGLLDLPSLVAASDRTAGLVLGAEDLCLDMGINRTRRGAELSFARWQITLCAHANGVAAIDAVFTNFEDLDGLWQEARSARNIGFTGKLAIHPRQIDAIHSAFAPDESEIDEARAALAAFERAQASGMGAIAFDGKMIDEPIAQRLREILRRAGTGSRPSLTASTSGRTRARKPTKGTG
jgi:citrate lyase subunit beta/citryl-CoA lyase